MMNHFQLLTMKELIHFKSISRYSLFKHTVDQFRRQYIFLNTLRIRRADVKASFAEVIDKSMVDKFEIDEWVHKSKNVFSKTFDQIVADSSSWNGQGVSERSLIKPLNDICYHNLHALLCLDLLANDSSEKGLLASNVNVGHFMERVAEDVSSFSKEKFGVCPEITIKGNLNILMIPPFIEFVTVEILKNAIKAVIDRYGALDIDDAPPIEICLKEKVGENGAGCVMFHDYGIGMQKEVADR
jgi:hypothetical protein